MTEPEDYVYIAVWAKVLGSLDYYVRNTQKKASKLNAPLDSLYRASDDTWFTASMLGKPGRESFNRHCRAMGVPLPDYEGEGE